MTDSYAQLKYERKMAVQTNRPITKLYPLEITATETLSEDTQYQNFEQRDQKSVLTRTVRIAAQKAKVKIREMMGNDNDDA
jgi:hypothetical protein